MQSALSLFTSREDALYTGKHHYSGNFTRFDDWNTKDGHVYIYKCVERDCKMRFRIVNLTDSPYWRLDLHKHQNCHTHNVSVKEHVERGIPEAFKEVIQELGVASSKLSNRQPVTPTEAENAIRKQYIKDPQYTELLLPSNHEKLWSRINSYIDYERRKNCVGDIVTISDIMAFISNNALMIPKGYIAREYTSPQEFAKAVGCELNDVWTLPIPECEAARLVAKYMSEVDPDSIYLTVLAVTPATQFTMLDQSVNLPCQLVQIDVTFNATYDGRVIIVIGCHDMRFRPGQY